jgi:hypothetical protein
MPLPRPASPRALWADLRAFWAHRPRHQWLAAVLALLIPAGILFIFYLDAKTNIMPGERVTFINSWPADRTDADIVAKQKADLAAREAALRARQREFQKLDERLKRYGI